ncbi:map kinase phosphatase-like protein [Sarcoptes scabiei]|uniref:Map kinase phosphatase-like protein n=1 Tax=Sarcoptes scabiei TaxID=52283 RepID=A0A131ZVE7_SARSC|nr:map kinase phosphatase-like protein [Sarcoptes scabiei]
MFRVKFQSFSSTHIMWNCFNDCVEPDATSRLEQRKWNRIRSFQISTKEPITIAKDSNLILDQNLHQTNEGIVINNGKINLSNIKSFIENHSTDKNALRLITNTEINKVTQNFYITSFAGLRLKTIKLLRIDLILNATIDLPSIDLSRDDGMETKILRVPISEKEPETLNRYIDNVADQIHYNYSLNKNTLLYCHDGSFNTIALAIGS